MLPPPTSDQSFKTVILEVFRLRIDKYLSKHCLKNYDIQTTVDVFSDSLVAAVKADILGERQRPFTYQTYASWWDHFKDTLPPWIKKHVKIKKITHEVTLATIYPYLKFEIPKDNLGKVVVLVNNVPKFNFEPNDHSKSTV